jgi:hypothetical protein
MNILLAILLRVYMIGRVRESIKNSSGFVDLPKGG